jgi:hypothetical protein
MVDRSNRVLIFQLEDWLGCVRMPAALHHAGFEVAGLCPENVHLARTRHLDRRYVYSATVSRSLLQRVRRTAESFAPRVTGLVRRALAPAVERVIDAERSGPRMLSFLADAIRDWRPGFVLCGDEPTRRLMCSAVLAANAGRSPLADDVLDVVRASAGNPRFFEQTNRKSALMEFCSRQGYPAPANQVVTRPGEVDTFAARHGYPVLLKLDFQAGGWGVIASSSPEQTRAAMSRMA